ncbi:FAD-dependent oxidoreductase, partial [Myxococcota bacterium]|nr:FAD-dependent oxidoreductase [Myxococcota bacterium]
DVDLAAEPRAPIPAANVRPVPPPLGRMASRRARPDAPPVIVVGAGPAGLFAAWHLAENGAKVILLERGKPVETRARDFGRFRGRAELDPESNLCFGEGGAGTYSDGKLTTRKHDPLVREVFERFVEVGAPARILVDAKPHIGTNLLFRMLQGLRARLLELGVDIRFQTRMERLVLEGRKIRGVETKGGQLDAGATVLAMGHSARDTFRALLAQGVPMEAKPFAVGVRAEHPQALIDSAQYRVGAPRPATLPAADYRLTHQEGTRGVYSFCMCPGGMIVPTATEPETVVVNGMSTARRSSPFANSGVIVQVSVEDAAREVGKMHPLVGVDFQHKLESAAFVAGGRSYRAPAMLASDLVRRKVTGKLADTHFRPGLTPSDLRAVLPRFVVDGLAAGLVAFDHKIKGYASSDANLIAVESRTSSPIQIPRDDASMEVAGFDGLFVAGEGPGYAGGITSAAIDGLKVAHAVLERLA